MVNHLFTTGDKFLKASLILFLCLVGFAPAKSQTQSLFQSGLAVRDSINERQVRLEFDLERDYDNSLYQRSTNMLIFQKPEHWNYPLYEIYNKEFILITDISSDLSEFPIYEYLAKYEVVIIDLQNLERQFTCNISGADLNGIRMRGEELFVNLGEPVHKEMKCDVFSNLFRK